MSACWLPDNANALRHDQKVYSEEIDNGISRTNLFGLSRASCFEAAGGNQPLEFLLQTLVQSARDNMTAVSESQLIKTIHELTLIKECRQCHVRVIRGSNFSHLVARSAAPGRSLTLPVLTDPRAPPCLKTQEFLNPIAIKESVAVEGRVTLPGNGSFPNVSTGKARLQVCDFS